MQKQAGYISDIKKEEDKYLCQIKLFRDIDKSILDSLINHKQFSFGYRIDN